MDEQKAFEKIFEIYKKHGWEDQKAFQKFLRETTGRVYYEILAHGILAYRKEKENHLVLYEGVKETLGALKEMGLKLGIVTDASKLQAYMRLVALGVENFFDVVVCFEDTKTQKPSNLPFNKALAKLGFKPDEVLFVGDSLNRDVKGAKEVGMQTAWAVYGRVRKEEAEVKPDFELESFRDLVKIVSTA